VYLDGYSHAKAQGRAGKLEPAVGHKRTLAPFWGKYICIVLFVLIQKVPKKSRKNDAIYPQANPRPPFFRADAL